MKAHICLCAVVLLSCAMPTGCRKHPATTKRESIVGSYDSEADWNDPQHVIPLNYRQAQGKRIFYQYCVWCHADASPAGPSNRSNLQPVPPLLNDGATLNSENDEYMQNIITLGGSAMGKSAMMPPYGRVLSQDDVRSVIAYARAIAQPAYQPPGRPGSQYSGK
jgi:mono/diheme cytochrome c family protein